MKRICLVVLFSLFNFILTAQATPFFLKGALKEDRQQLYHKLVNIINNNLPVPLTDSTEEQWEDAFWTMELINYRSAFIDTKIYEAFNNIQNNSSTFQRALLELVYANYPTIFLKQVRSLLLETNDAKIFAMCAVYILQAGKSPKEKDFLAERTKTKLSVKQEDPILQQLQFQLNNYDSAIVIHQLTGLLKKDFLAGNVIMFSFQRKNRDYPGLVIIRDAAGNFMEEHHKLFFVPQLARSVSGLPAYLTNGNTPEGIFRMDRFDTSKSNFIGPTTNIQLTMPFEYKPSHFYNDPAISDSGWNMEQYKELLPPGLKNYYPFYQSFYAGKAGRTEIIAHGTTVDPAYYKTKPYFPLTPTQGCLCTKEIWNEENGRLLESDQQKLVDMIIKAGGPHGYAIVINIDDQQKPVTINEISDFLQQANQK